MVDYKKMTLGDLVSQIVFKDNIGEDNANSLKNKILDKEQYIIDLPSDIGYEGVARHSITNKHSAYNLIDFNFPEVNILLEKLKLMVQPINFNNNELYVKMWANIYRKGEYIKKHSHIPVKNDDETRFMAASIFSGHCFLYSDVPTSTTFYFGPQQMETEVNNVVGEIDIFSSLVPHEFKPYDGELRVGLAFDFVLGEKYFNHLFKQHLYKKI